MHPRSVIIYKIYEISQARQCEQENKIREAP